MAIYLPDETPSMAQLPVWKGVPPKEGRSHLRSGSFDVMGVKISSRTKNTITRLLMVAALIFTIHWFLSSPSDTNTLPKAIPKAQGQNAVAREAAPEVIAKPVEAIPETSQPDSSIGDDRQTVLSTIDTDHDVDAQAPAIDKIVADSNIAAPKITKPSKSQSTNGRDAELETALENVISLLPNELTARGLLSEVRGSGKEKLREMGLRSRSYKKYFEAWSALHFTTLNDVLYIRDDIIQYLRSHQDFAASLTSSLAETVRSYENFRHFLQSFADLLFPWTAPYFADHMTLHKHFWNGGQGIVLTGGDGQAPYLLTSIASFRKLGCTLPIEIMYLGENDLSEEWRVELEALDGVLTRDMSQMVKDEGWELRGWAAKPFAILLSSFKEVIFIDADALFFRDPAVLFEDPLYKETGTLFFKDRIIMPESKKQWLKEILPAPVSKKVKTSRYWTGVSGHMQESGVVVVDKWQHIIALLLVTRMNGPDRDGNKDKGIVGVYDMVYGDKETYWLGWELVGDLNYAFHSGDAGIIGTLQTPEELERRKLLRKPRHRKKPEEEAKGYSPPDEAANAVSVPEPEIEEPTTYTVCAPQLLHLDNDNKPLWFNGWILSNKFAESKKQKGQGMDVFLREPNEEYKKAEGERDPWQLQQHNEACLTAKEKYTFEDKDKTTLDMIIGLAKDVGAYGKG